MTRGVRAAEKAPKLGSVWLQALNISVRNCRNRSSDFRGNRLLTEISQLFTPGPRRMPTPPLPKSPLAGNRKALVLKFRKKVLSPFDNTGAPTTWMRAFSLDPVISAALVVVKSGVMGAPVMNDVIPLICQLSSTQPMGFEPIR